MLSTPGNSIVDLPGVLSLLPPPDSSRKIEGDSARRVEPDGPSLSTINTDQFWEELSLVGFVVRKHTWSVRILVGTEVLARLALALLPCFNRIISLSVKTQRIAGIKYKIKGSSLSSMPVLVGRQTKGGRGQCSLVPRAFPLKNGWPHPFFKGKALGTRLRAVTLPGNWEAGLKRLKRFPHQ